MNKINEILDELSDLMCWAETENAKRAIEEAMIAIALLTAFTKEFES